jgi:hypothetical protein
MIDGRLFGPTNVQGRPTDAHFEPHPDALIAIMKALLQSDPTKRKLPLVEREKSVSQFHWGIAARALKSLFVDLITSR